jgi:hypothetical protein
MENTPLLSRDKDPENDNNNNDIKSPVNNAGRTLVFARIITVIGVIIGITVLVSRSDRIGTKNSSFKDVANVQQGTAFGKKNHSTIV